MRLSILIIFIFFGCQQSKNELSGKIIYVKYGASSMLPSYCNNFPSDWSPESIDTLTIENPLDLEEILRKIRKIKVAKDSLQLLDIRVEKKLIIHHRDTVETVCMGQFDGLILNDRVMQNDTSFIYFINSLIDN